MEIAPDLAGLIAKLADVVFNQSLSFDPDLYFRVTDKHKSDDMHTPYVFYYGKEDKLIKLNTWKPKKQNDFYVFEDDDFSKIGSVLFITNGQFDGSCIIEPFGDARFHKPDKDIYPGLSDGRYKGYKIWKYNIDISLDYDGVTINYGACVKTQNNNLSYDVLPLSPVQEKYKWWKDLEDPENIKSEIMKKMIDS
jgi:hypothetical protein